MQARLDERLALVEERVAETVREGVLHTLAAIQALPCFQEYLQEARALGEREGGAGGAPLALALPATEAQRTGRGGLGESEGRAGRAKDAGMARLEMELERLGSFARREVEMGVQELGGEVWAMPEGEVGGGGESKSLAQQLVERGKTEANKKAKELQKTGIAEAKKHGQMRLDGIKEDLEGRSNDAANALAESALGVSLFSSGDSSAVPPLYDTSALTGGFDGSALPGGLEAALDNPVEMLAQEALQPLAETAAGAIKVAAQAWVSKERALFDARLDGEFEAARAQGSSLQDLHTKFVEAFPASFVKRVLNPKP